jgi:hypothetical protein
VSSVNTSIFKNLENRVIKSLLFTLHRLCREGWTVKEKRIIKEGHDEHEEIFVMMARM